MALSPAGANVTKKDRKTGWSRFRPAQLGAALLLSTGVLSAAVAVAAAREPDPMVAYGPPSAPNTVTVAPLQFDEVGSTITAQFTAADPLIVAEVPAISTQVATAPASEGATLESPTYGAAAEDQAATDVVATPTATSSTVESPELVASSWSMDPLPEGEGGTVASSTSVDPITPTSSMVASPQ